MMGEFSSSLELQPLISQTQPHHPIHWAIQHDYCNLVEKEFPLSCPYPRYFPIYTVHHVTKQTNINFTRHVANSTIKGQVSCAGPGPFFSK